MFQGDLDGIVNLILYALSRKISVSRSFFLVGLDALSFDQIAQNLPKEEQVKEKQEQLYKAWREDGAFYVT